MFRTTLVTAFVCIINLLANPVSAQPLADSIPENALIYVGWAGTDNLGPDYENSHLQALLDASNLRQLGEKTLPEAIVRVGAIIDKQMQQGGGGGFPIGSMLFKSTGQSVLVLGEQLLRKPAALYIAWGPEERDEDRVDPISMALILDDVDRVDYVVSILELATSTFNQMRPGPVNQLIVQSHEKRIVVMTSNVPKGWHLMLREGSDKNTVSQTPAFLTAKKKLQKNPAAVVFVNFEAINSMVNDWIKQKMDRWPESAAQDALTKEATGINNLRSITWTAGMAGKGWQQQLYIQASAPRKGYVKLMDAKPIDLALVKLVPESATVATAFYFNPADMLRQHTAVMRTTSEYDRERHVAFLVEADKMLGMSLQNELLPVFGSHWIYYADRNMTGDAMFTGVFINPLPNPKLAQERLNKASTAMVTALNRWPAVVKGTTMNLRTAKVRGYELHYLSIPGISPTWAIHDGKLFASLHMESVITALQFADGKLGNGKSLLDHPVFKRELTRMGNVKELEGKHQVVGFKFIDTPRLIPEAYGNWQVLARALLGGGDLLDAKSTPATLLPRMSQVMQHTEPTVAIVTADGEGLLIQSYESFPFATPMALLRLNAVNDVPSVMGTAVPFFGAARHQAMKITEMSNVRQIMIAIIMYSTDNNGNTPDSFGDLHGYIDGGDVFLSPLSGKREPRGFDDWPSEKQKAWVKENTDFIYLDIGNLGRHVNPSRQVLIFTNSELAKKNGGVTVGWADGHVTFEKDWQRIVTIVEKFHGNEAAYEKAQGNKQTHE